MEMLLVGSNSADRRRTRNGAPQAQAPAQAPRVGGSTSAERRPSGMGVTSTHEGLTSTRDRRSPWRWSQQAAGQHVPTMPRSHAGQMGCLLWLRCWSAPRPLPCRARMKFQSARHLATRARVLLLRVA